MKKVPFFANSQDDSHCVQASLRIMLKYFLPKREFDYEALDKMTHKVADKGTWWFPFLLELQGLGLEVKEISSFDYERFYREREDYLRSIYPRQTAEYYLQRSNILDFVEKIPDFLAKIAPKQRRATLKDIDELLYKGWLVGLDLNSRALNDLSGYSSHMVVVYEKKDSIYLVHDPGLPPRPARKVPRDMLLAAWESGGIDNTSLLALRKK